LTIFANIKMGQQTAIGYEVEARAVTTSSKLKSC
jgi:hypothetical protein